MTGASWSQSTASIISVPVSSGISSPLPAFNLESQIIHAVQLPLAEMDLIKRDPPLPVQHCRFPSSNTCFSLHAMPLHYICRHQLQSQKSIAARNIFNQYKTGCHSAMLKKFEEELDAELFDRSPNRIHLNKTGEIALIHVNNILRDIEQMKADIRSTAQKDLTLSVAFCDPGVRWFCVPRFSLAYPDIHLQDDLYEGTEAAKLLKDRVYDLIVTPYKIKESHVSSIPFLKVITKNDLPITMLKNNFNIYQHLIRTTNFLATISRLSIDLRNDGTHRALIPLSDPELSVLFYVSF